MAQIAAAVTDKARLLLPASENATAFIDKSRPREHARVKLPLTTIQPRQGKGCYKAQK
jgi:hypothetical protein